MDEEKARKHVHKNNDIGSKLQKQQDELGVDSAWNRLRNKEFPNEYRTFQNQNFIKNLEKLFNDKKITFKQIGDKIHYVDSIGGNEGDFTLTNGKIKHTSDDLGNNIFDEKNLKQNIKKIKENLQGERDITKHIIEHGDGL